MGDADKYLRELDRIKNREKNRRIREIYRRKLSYNNPKHDEEEAQQLFFRDYDLSENLVKVQSIAYKLMTYDSPNSFITGAKLYEKLGKGRKAVPRLIKATERAAKKGSLTDNDFHHIKSFIERNAGKRKSSESGLEGKTMLFALFVLVGIALGAFSLTATGNAIGNLTGTAQGLLGVFLFIAGITGLVFNFKKK